MSKNETLQMPGSFHNKYRIASARWQEWDYGQNGAYFITICTAGRQHFFGQIVNDAMALSSIGHLALRYWKEIPDHFPFIYLDEFVVMPNHVHGILIINKHEDQAVSMTIGEQVETRHCLVSGDSPGRRRFRNPGKENISSIIGSYKAVVSKHAHAINSEFRWQARFHDHVIRNAEDFERIRQYIFANPENWKKDDFY